MKISDILNFMKKNEHETNILLRDITGECEGECRDRVREGELERQNKINLYHFEDIESYPNATWAHFRNEPPGVWGGHV